MHLITDTKQFLSKKAHPQHAFLICPFGGKITHMRRLIGVLVRAGFDVTAISYSKDVLAKGDPTLLPTLIKEVESVVLQTKTRSQSPPLLVGVSLGGLVAYNLLKRQLTLQKAILITGGNVVRAAKNFYGDLVWPQPYDQLMKTWSDVNIYTDPKMLAGKKIVMILPKRDDVIDSSEVIEEQIRHVEAGNQFVMVQRPWFGHRKQVIIETILFPGRVKKYIRLLNA